MTPNPPANHDSTNPPSDVQSRRRFLKTTVVAAAAAVAGGCATVPDGQGGDRPARLFPAIRPRGIRPQRLRVGVIGCGGRGTEAAQNCVEAAPEVEIVALADAFEDRLEKCYQALNEFGAGFQVSRDLCFAGYDSYKWLLSCDLDLVILATPPGFRPQHYQAAVDAGKHVFIEKPVAVDPIGVRSVIRTSALAASKKLAVVAGTQRRHNPSYIETLRRVRDGAIGDIVAAQCYWNQGLLWVKKREPQWSDLEWQCRNWLYFTWLSGDQIVEQHVHNIDVINWALQATPVKAIGMGGRQARTAPEYGNIYDHFSVEFEYPGGVRVQSMCRQVKGASERIGERLVGTRGTAIPKGEITRGKRTWKYPQKGEPVNPMIREHTDLIASIRSGQPLNEGQRIAESTLTAIMGRMSAYTGREISWEWARYSSKLDLTPCDPEARLATIDPVAVPGVTKLV